ncbi:FkbM family methyltransferase [Pedobacter sp. Leaf250]|uniref:FkbM family methyltransferase n=1 Tax=Pedobacter sp. Leaf250 TaxID=2876559 RepID=UPI001E486D1B|nr:FkbM family methyltransferase [Pedobacter sp. Leaf250]
MFFKNKYRRKSYSQCGEDLIIKYIFDNIGISKPSYLDIGAHHPYFLSNTFLFYETGSRGINVEPDSTLFPIFLKKRKKDTNLNIGVGLSNSIEDFYIMSSRTLNTFSKTEAERYQNEENFPIKQIIKTKVVTIKDILNKYNGGIFPDLLNIDVEGFDEKIVRSINYLENPPKVICIETLTFSTSGNEIKNHNLINFLCSNGYFLYSDTYINTIFVLKDIWIKRFNKETL